PGKSGIPSSLGRKTPGKLIFFIREPFISISSILNSLIEKFNSTPEADWLSTVNPASPQLLSKVITCERAENEIMRISKKLKNAELVDCFFPTFNLPDFSRSCREVNT